MSEVSTNFKINVHRTAPCEVQHVLVEITHPLIPEAIRLASNEACGNKPVHSGGFDYIPCAFDFTWINDIENEVPRGAFIVSNIGKPLMRWVEQSIGGKNAVITMFVVQENTPDVREFEARLRVSSCVANLERVTFELNVQDNFTRRGTRKIFDPNSAPGLF